MKVTLHASSLKGSIQAPASKSSMQRACAAALVAGGRTEIYNPGHSNDDQAALDIIQRLGAKLDVQADRIIVESQGVRPVAGDINCGESGLSIRMFTPLAALSSQPVTINGTGSLVTRPMDFFDEILPRLGVQIQSQSGKLPLRIQGALQPRDIEVDGSLSSQFLTGLLLAYAASPDITRSRAGITVRNLKSKPYVDLTLDVMRRFGLPVPVNHQYERFVFENAASPAPGQTSRSYTVEGDWSGGAFLLVAGAMAGSITIHGLDLASTQADKAVVDALMKAGAGIAMDAKSIRMHRSPMRGFQFDATDCPDLFPPLVALAAYCQGTTEIRGVSRLTHKESNRALTLQEEFGKMGVPVELDGDRMIIRGGNPLSGASVHSRHDHRIAMALAVAALGASGETTIEESQAVKKSYPDFFQDLKSLGASLSLPFQLIN